MKLAETIARFIQMLVGNAPGRIHPLHIGLKIIALAWVLNPGYFHDSPSLRQLARRCGVTPATLAHLTGHYSRFIHWRNRAQRHAWNWQNRGLRRATNGNGAPKSE